MFQLFLRARADTFFKAHSPVRDAETDCARIASIASSIDAALRTAEA
jgi:hypothetical protein